MKTCKTCSKKFSYALARYCGDKCRKIASANRGKEYYKKNKESISVKKKKYYKKNKENVCAKSKEYRKKNKTKIAKSNYEYQKKRYHNDSLFRLQLILRGRFRKFLKQNKEI